MNAATARHAWLIRPVQTKYGRRYQAVCRWADGVELQPGRPHFSVALCRAYIRREFGNGTTCPKRSAVIAEGWSDCPNPADVWKHYRFPGERA
jgi:hypothetical protein